MLLYVLLFLAILENLEIAFGTTGNFLHLARISYRLFWLPCSMFGLKTIITSSWVVGVANLSIKASQLYLTTYMQIIIYSKLSRFLRIRNWFHFHHLLIPTLLRRNTTFFLLTTFLFRKSLLIHEDGRGGTTFLFIVGIYVIKYRRYILSFIFIHFYKMVKNC